MEILKSFVSDFVSSFKIWKEIDHPPRWVLRAYEKWNARLGTRPYNMTKHFVGKTFVYRVRHGQGMQGEAPILGWYRILR